VKQLVTHSLKEHEMIMQEYFVQNPHLFKQKKAKAGQAKNKLNVGGGELSPNEPLSLNA
jgi:hypothetical protein